MVNPTRHDVTPFSASGYRQRLLMTDVPVDDALPDADADLDEVGKFLVRLEERALLIANARELGRRFGRRVVASRSGRRSLWRPHSHPRLIENCCGSAAVETAWPVLRTWRH